MYSEGKEQFASTTLGRKSASIYLRENGSALFVDTLVRRECQLRQIVQLVQYVLKIEYTVIYLRLG